jgi:hypothetical protein
MPRQKVSKYRVQTAEIPRVVDTLLAVEVPEPDVDLVELLQSPEMRRAIDHLRSLGLNDVRVAELIGKSGIDAPVGALRWALRAALPRPSKRREPSARGASPDSAPVDTPNQPPSDRAAAAPKASAGPSSAPRTASHEPAASQPGRSELTNVAFLEHTL